MGECGGRGQSHLLPSTSLATLLEAPVPVSQSGNHSNFGVGRGRAGQRQTVLEGPPPRHKAQFPEHCRQSCYSHVCQVQAGPEGV